MPRPFKKNLARMRKDAVAIFNSGVKAVLADRAIKKHCRLAGQTLWIDKTPFDLTRYKNLYILGAGKASARMGAAMEKLLLPKITGGIITVKYDHTANLKKIKLIEAGHPIPDKNGLRGAGAILRLAEKADKNDLVICLISGGGSALMPLPAGPISLADKQKTIATMLSCGASIQEINVVRKHLSAIKGGLLAKKACPATLISLILSDVVGDSLDIIASGPTVPDPSSFNDCVEILRSYGLTRRIPKTVTAHIQKGAAGKIPETPKPGDPVFQHTFNRIIGSNAAALFTAASKAESLGYQPLILSSMIEGDTRNAARFHAAIAKEIRKTANPVAPPACVLSGGETVVTVKGDGMGGRNQEFALVAGMEIQNEKNMVVLSAGTDGTDGPTDAAGAIVDSASIKNALAHGVNPHPFLENNDSYTFFKKTGGLMFTGPTGTNVMDLRMVLVG